MVAAFLIAAAGLMTIAAPAGASGPTNGSVVPGVTQAVSDLTVPSVSVLGLTPTSGTAGGGTTVLISGAGFSGATAIYFGANSSSSFSVASATTVTAVAPVGTGTVDVRVATPSGTSNPSTIDRFTYVATGQLPIAAHGQALEIGGVPTKFTGVNAYQLATSWGINAGCGPMASHAQIDAFFASLPPDSMVRFWAFQGTMATNVHTDQLDWSPLDYVFAEAAKYHVYLIPVISGQGGSCDENHWNDPAWYSGGFKDVYNSPSNSDGRELTPLSYWVYMNALVNRYADSPALGMWEPMSEAEASSCPASFEPSNCSGNQTCPKEAAAATALKYFLTAVGERIHAHDPKHLVEEGLLGGSQCGASGSDYENVGASPGIDVLSVHDYYGPVPLGGGPSDGIATRLAQAKALDKPIITGEAGIVAGEGQSNCMSLQQRATDMSEKMTAQFALGDSAFLIWNWQPSPLGPCSYDTGLNDNSLPRLGAAVDGVP